MPNQHKYRGFLVRIPELPALRDAARTEGITLTALFQRIAREHLGLDSDGEHGGQVGGPELERTGSR